MRDASSNVVTPLDPGPMRTFLDELGACLEQLDETAVERIIDVVVQAHRTGRAVFIMGNGGSAATASHFACDLQAAARGQRPLRVRSLNDNVPLLTALANDHGYENVFSEQIASHAVPGDVVIVLSVSGDSENVVRALQKAKEHGAVTVGILGFGGGRAGGIVDHSVLINSRRFGIVESVHNALEHLVTEAFRARLARTP